MLLTYPKDMLYLYLNKYIYNPTYKFPIPFHLFLLSNGIRHQIMISKYSKDNKDHF